VWATEGGELPDDRGTILLVVGLKGKREGGRVSTKTRRRCDEEEEVKGTNLARAVGVELRLQFEKKTRESNQWRKKGGRHDVRKGGERVRLTSEAIKLPPYQTAYLCFACEMTFTSTPED